MTKELVAFTDTGLTLYAVLLNSVGQVWDGSQFETIASGTWTDNDIALTEATAGIYQGDMPAVVAGAYSYAVYSQAGASPAITDTLKGNGYILWDGTDEIIPSQTGDAMTLATDAVNSTSLATSAVTEIAAGITAPTAAAIADAVWDEEDVLHKIPRTMGNVVRQIPIIKNMNPVPKVWDDERAKGLFDLVDMMPEERVRKLDNLDVAVSTRSVRNEYMQTLMQLRNDIVSMRQVSPATEARDYSQRLDAMESNITALLGKLNNLDAPISSVKQQPDPRMQYLDAPVSKCATKEDLPKAKDISITVKNDKGGEEKRIIFQIDDEDDE